MDIKNQTPMPEQIKNIKYGPHPSQVQLYFYTLLTYIHPLFTWCKVLAALHIFCIQLYSLVSLRFFISPVVSDINFDFQAFATSGKDESALGSDIDGLNESEACTTAFGSPFIRSDNARFNRLNFEAKHIKFMTLFKWLHRFWSPCKQLMASVLYSAKSETNCTAKFSGLVILWECRKCLAFWLWE